MARRLRWTAILSLLLLCAAFAPAAHASEPPHPVTIKVDGRTIPFPDAQPLFANDRILVPVRFVSEALGATVGWDPVQRTATIQKGARFIRLSPSAACDLDACNGAALTENLSRLACLAPDCTDGFLLDVAPRILQDRTYVPLRFVAEALGADVSWFKETWTAELRSGQGSGFSTTRAQLNGLPSVGTISTPATLTVSGVSGSLVQFWAIDPGTRQGYLLGASADVGAPLKINGYAVPAAGRYLVVAGVWIGDRWSYSYPRLVNFAPTGDPWAGDKRTWLSGYPEDLTYRHRINVDALANFERGPVTWLLDNQAQPEHGLTFDRTFTPADQGSHTLRAIVPPTDGSPALNTDEIHFNVDVTSIYVSGLAHDQVITDSALLSVGKPGFTQIEYRVETPDGRIVYRDTTGYDQTLTLRAETIGQGLFQLVATGRRADGSGEAAAPIPFYSWPNGHPQGPPPATPDQQQAFLHEYLPVAMDVYARTGLSPSLQVAQAIHESGWGLGELTDFQSGQRSYNLFGIKAVRAEDPSVRDITREVVDTRSFYYLHRFLRWDSPAAAWQGRAEYLLGSRAFGTIGLFRSNPDAGLALLTTFGYATDPDYGRLVQALLNQTLPDGRTLRSLDRIQF
jgi:hypothetical protein